MPSPFPGMDPWLEARHLWPGVHSELIVQLRHLLVPQVRPTYFVDVEEHVLDEDELPQRTLVPDVSMTPTGRGSAGPSRQDPEAGTEGAGRRLLPALVLMSEELEVRERRLVIRSVRDRTVVTVVELLSHVNKGSPGTRGRQEYLSKRRELLRSQSHLIEIDLLRAGHGIPSVEPLPAGDYHAHVSRVELRPRGEVFSWSVRDPLPVLPVPLRGEDVRLSLGEAVARAYDQAGYDAELDYTRPPVPPLGAEDQVWAEALLRDRGR